MGNNLTEKQSQKNPRFQRSENLNVVEGKIITLGLVKPITSSPRAHIKNNNIENTEKHCKQRNIINIFHSNALLGL